MRTVQSVWSCFVVAGRCKSEIKGLNFCTWSPVFHLPRVSNLHICKPGDSKRDFSNLKRMLYAFFCGLFLLQLIKTCFTNNYSRTLWPWYIRQSIMGDWLAQITFLSVECRPERQCSQWDVATFNGPHPNLLMRQNNRELSALNCCFMLMKS